jgi:hypothetical protein
MSQLDKAEQDWEDAKLNRHLDQEDEKAQEPEGYPPKPRGRGQHYFESGDE